MFFKVPALGRGKRGAKSKQCSGRRTQVSWPWPNTHPSLIRCGFLACITMNASTTVGLQSYRVSRESLSGRWMDAGSALPRPSFGDPAVAGASATAWLPFSGPLASQTPRNPGGHLFSRFACKTFQWDTWRCALLSRGLVDATLVLYCFGCP